jgi:UDP-N-acetylmuramate--alanine ligase
MKNEKFYFLGIGGSGMAPLANILLDRGYFVSGYDSSQKSSNIEKLIQRGVAIDLTPNQEKIQASDKIIYSSAIDLNQHPGAILANKFQKTLLHRSEVLHELASNKISISIAGSHGKTSTTTMIFQIFNDQSIKSGIMIGGETSLINNGGGQDTLDSKYFIFESDESDGSFLNFNADYKIITNIDSDHLDHYKTKENLINAFFEYSANPKEKTIIFLDDFITPQILSKLKSHPSSNTFLISNQTNLEWEKLIHYSISEDHQYLNIHYKNQIYKLECSYPGLHYLKNASIAFVLSMEIGLDPTQSLETLKNYKGVKRRLELLGKFLERFEVYDDYGHHPEEIRAVISSLKKRNSKLHVLFQPHRFSRTHFLYKEFSDSLKNADFVYLLPIYSAGEVNTYQSSTVLIYNELLKVHNNVILLDENKENFKTSLERNLGIHDLILVIGAGDVRNWGEYLLKI